MSNTITAQVVCLTSDKYNSPLAKDLKRGEFIYTSPGYWVIMKPDMQLTVPVHLYFTTDQEIKTGDWFIYSQTLGKSTGSVIEGSKKIIASTNPDLWYTDERTERGKFEQLPREKGIHYANFKPSGIARIPYSFVKSFIRSKGGLAQVLVKWEAQASVPHVMVDDYGNVVIQEEPKKREILTIQEFYMLREAVYAVCNSDAVSAWQARAYFKDKKNLNEMIEKLRNLM